MGNSEVNGDIDANDVSLIHYLLNNGVSADDVIEEFLPPYRPAVTQYLRNHGEVIGWSK